MPFKLAVFCFSIISLRDVCTSEHHVEPTSLENKIEVPIPKLCSPGKVLTFDDGPGCDDVDQGHNWTAFVYDSITLRRVNTFTPKYTLAPADQDCAVKDIVILANTIPTLSPSIDHTSTEITSLFILLTNGKIMWRSNKCTCGKCTHWKTFPGQVFVDGVGKSIFDENNVKRVYHSGLERDQILYYCKSHLGAEVAESNGYNNLGNDKIFVVILFITSFIYCITTLLYGMIWSSHKLPGRILFSVVLSRMMMSLMLGLGYTGKLNRWDELAPTWCFIVAVCIHFFMISSYSWVTLLNFNLWWTFRGIRPTANKNNLNKTFIQYSLFGWGLPLLITTLSVIINSFYRARADINYNLVPNYGNGICFIVQCALGIYVHLFTSLFLIPALTFSIMTFVVLFKIRFETASVRDAKHGKNQTSFQLYFKLLVIMGVSWILGYVVWYFHKEDDGSNSFSARNTTLLIIHWVVDLLGSSTFILVIFGFSQTNRSKLEQNYPMFRATFNVFHNLKNKIPKTTFYTEGSDSSSPVIAQSTTSE